MISSEKIVIKYVLLFTFSFFVPLEPKSCKRIICIKAKAPMAKPRIKCIEKNLFKVCSHTVKPPQTNSTANLPTKGIIVKKLVITVAAQ